MPPMPSLSSIRRMRSAYYTMTNVSALSRLPSWPNFSSLRLRNIPYITVGTILHLIEEVRTTGWNYRNVWHVLCTGHVRRKAVVNLGFAPFWHDLETWLPLAGSMRGRQMISSAGQQQKQQQHRVYIARFAPHTPSRTVGCDVFLGFYQK